MKMKMAETDDVSSCDIAFDVGMVVSCTTCHGEKIDGEVVAFDYPSKMLALKSPSESGKPSPHDVRILNITYVSEVNVLKEAVGEPAALTALNLPKLQSRLKKNYEEKCRQANYIGIGVTPQAQKLFHQITKTISEVRWDGQKIVVLEEVTISPPYQPDNCQSKDSSGSATLQHICKIVEKYHRDQARESSASPSS